MLATLEQYFHLVEQEEVGYPGSLEEVVELTLDHYGYLGGMPGRKVKFLIYIYILSGFRIRIFCGSGSGQKSSCGSGSGSGSWGYPGEGAVGKGKK